MWIGQAPLRREGRDKVTGRSRYVDDLLLADMWHGVTVRSNVPRGRIGAIRYRAGVPWDEIVVVTAKDVPGKNYVAVIEDDQPFLADELVNHAEEPIVLLAHPDRYLLEEARRLVEIDVEPLPAVLTLEESLAAGTIVWREDNQFKKYLVQKGDVERVFGAKDVVVVEGEYRTGAQEQLYIENNGVIAKVDQESGVTVWGSMQCPYYVHKALLTLFGLPAEKVRVIQTETGGGFGGKEEYPSLIAGHAALLSMKARHPVKLIYDRAEDMVATTKRHPSRTRHKTAVSKDGKLQAMDIEFVIDGGAYATLSSVVLSRGTIHAAGPYLCDNVRVRSRAMATNTPPHGAFRGFGAPQSIFALERHLDRVAEAVGLSPEELRRRNFLKAGDETATGQVLREPMDLPKLLGRALAESGYHQKKQAFLASNPSSKIKKGIGLATFLHGSGFTGSGEVRLASVVGVEALADGRVRVLSASTEIGQGTNTIFSQIAAEALGLPLEQIEVAQPDTQTVPNSGPTVASRTVMVVGKLVESAAIGLRETLVQSGLLQAGYTPAAFSQACASYLEKHGALKAYSQYQPPPGVHWDDDKYQGDAYAGFAWAAYVAEVSVDTSTYEVRVDDFVAVQEIGRVVHPVLAAGQIEGGVAQGVGFALYENVVWKNGRMSNGQMTNYIMPTSVDVPAIRVFFEESPSPYGPGGAKGIGELPLDGPAPAIAAAIENAVGVRVAHVPFMPEDLMLAMEARHG